MQGIFGSRAVVLHQLFLRRTLVLLKLNVAFAYSISQHNYTCIFKEN
jgi:hypothetical protein